MLSGVELPLSVVTDLLSHITNRELPVNIHSSCDLMFLWH
jgi:hypothetical protein